MSLLGESEEQYYRGTMVSSLTKSWFYILIKSSNGDPTGIRTRDTTVKGWCLNRLTIGPYVFLSFKPNGLVLFGPHWPILMVAGVGFEPTTSGLWARRATKLLHPATWCRESESNRYGVWPPQDFKSCASASSATPALSELLLRCTDFILLQPL